MDYDNRIIWRNELNNNGRPVPFVYERVFRFSEDTRNNNIDNLIGERNKMTKETLILPKGVS